MSYSSSFAYTHLGQLWQGPLNGSGATQQYLYCDSTHPHQLKGLYPVGTTCTNPTGATYSSQYDNWGNITSRTYNGTTATVSYDILDHLTQWNAGSTSQEWYAYDASGNRVIRRSTTGSGTNITTYAFGLEDHTYDASGNITNNTYYYTLGGRLIGELTGTGTAATQFFLTDVLGSVLTTFNATAGIAAIQGNQVYGPYGSSLYKQGSPGTSKGFTGQYSDTTGLDYYNARYYDSVVGVFLSVDTVQGNAQGMNPYAYVGNNPETYNDPSGNRYIQTGGGGGGSSSSSPTSPPHTSQIPPPTGGAWWQNAAYNYYRYDVAPYSAYLDAQFLYKNSSKRDTSLQMATILERGTTLFRGTLNNPNDGRNVGDAFYYLTDSSGDVQGIPAYVTYAPVLGSNQGGHSEQVIMSVFKTMIDWYTGWLRASSAARCHEANWTVHLTLFTEIAPCTVCHNMLLRQAQQIRAELNRVGVSFDMWVWNRKDNNGGRPASVLRGKAGLVGARYSYS